jgi:hypothetical protein
VNAVIVLKDIVDAFEMVGDEVTCFLNPETGEILPLTSDDFALVEDEASVDELSDWERRIVPVIREIRDSNKWLVLPGQFEIHELSIMERFAVRCAGSPGVNSSWTLSTGAVLSVGLKVPFAALESNESGTLFGKMHYPTSRVTGSIRMGSSTLRQGRQTAEKGF